MVHARLVAVRTGRSAGATPALVADSLRPAVDHVLPQRPAPAQPCSHRDLTSRLGCTAVNGGQVSRPWAQVGATSPVVRRHTPDAGGPPAPTRQTPVSTDLGIFDDRRGRFGRRRADTSVALVIFLVDAPPSARAAA